MPEPGAYDVEFAATLAEVARGLLDERGVDATLEGFAAWR